MKKLLIIGGSRGIGLEAVRYGLAKGYRVRVLARSASGIAIRDAALEKCNGDALAPADVAAALEGVDTVIQAVGLPAGPEMLLGPVRLFSQSTRVLLAAMKDAGVRRLVSVTGFGAGESRAKIGCLRRVPFQLILGRAYDDKTIQESLIRESDRDWVIVRPVILTKGPMSGRYRVLVEPEEWRGGLIPRADVAHFLIGQVEDDSYLGTTPVVLKYPL